MSEEDWRVWLIKKDDSGTYTIQKELKNVDSNLIQEIKYLVKVGKKRYLQDNVF